MAHRQHTARRRRPIIAGVGLVALVATACGSGEPGAAGPTSDQSAQVQITVTDDGCEPTPGSVAAGAVSFEVENTGASSVSEVEVLSDGRIIGEKENLTPGLSATIDLRLEAGSYSILCPNAVQDTWPLEVSGDATGSALAPDVQSDLTEATAAYHDYVLVQVDALVAATDEFTAAIEAGDLVAATRLYAPARYPYEQIEPVAESFGDLDPAIDARINDVSDSDQWTGFHRLEKAIWEDRSLEGMTPVADQLTADIAALRDAAATAEYQPAQLANGATELLNEVASSKITGEENRYSHTDLSDFEANIRGGKKASDLLVPALTKIDPTLTQTVQDRYDAVLASLQPYAGQYAGTDYVNYETVDQAQRRELTQKVDALAEPLSKVAAEVTG